MIGSTWNMCTGNPAQMKEYQVWASDKAFWLVWWSLEHSFHSVTCFFMDKWKLREMESSLLVVLAITLKTDVFYLNLELHWWVRVHDVEDEYENLFCNYWHPGQPYILCAGSTFVPVLLKLKIWFLGIICLAFLCSSENRLYVKRFHANWNM